jgi:hypothetical protein
VVTTPESDRECRRQQKTLKGVAALLLANGAFLMWAGLAQLKPETELVASSVLVTASILVYVASRAEWRRRPPQ